VGHTTNFKQRKAVHKNTCNNEKHTSFNLKLYTMIRSNGGWEMFVMIEVEKYPCNDKREAAKRENELMKEMKASMNMINSFRTNEERLENGRQRERQRYKENKEEIIIKKKEYRENNKDKLKETRKEYTEKNKEKIKQTKKEYREKNREKIKQTQKEYREKNKEIKKKYYEENKEEILKKRKEYSEKNKEKIKQTQKEYREKNKEKLKISLII
jgi:hypothetical protein